MAIREKLLQQNGNRTARWSPRPFRVAAAGAALAFLAVSQPIAADAAQRIVPRIDGFGPYKLGMTVAQARAANPGAKQGDCGDIAVDRQCLKLDAAVFEEPAVIYAVLDEAGARVARIVAQMDPQLTRRRAYRCVRLSEKVFALLVVVYGAKYKQSYDENRRPLPAVAWDGEEMGRLVFETRCKTPDEGNPRISVVEHYPDGIKPPPVAEASKPAPKVAAAAPVTVDATAPVASVPLSIEGQGVPPQTPAAEDPNVALAPPPRAAPVGVVETIAPGAPDTSGALAADAALAALEREVAEAKGKVRSSTQPATRDAAPAHAAPEAAATPPPSVSAPATAAPATAAADQTAIEQPAAATPAPAGRYEVPVDIAPAAPVPTTAVPTAAARTAVAAAVAQPSDGNAVPPSAVIDPGPVTLPPLAPPVATTAPAPATTAVPAAAPVIATPAPKPPAVPAPAPATVQAKPDPSPAGTLAYAAPGPHEQTPAGAGPRPWPGRPLQTAIVPPPVNPPYYGEPGAYREPTDLEAPEAFTVPEEEGMDDRAAAADTVPAASAPALAATDEKSAARTIEAEVERRLAAAPITYDALSRAPGREPAAAPAVPTSLLSSASVPDTGRDRPRTAASAPAVQAPPQPPAPTAVAAVPAAAPPKPAATAVPPSAPPSALVKAPAVPEAPAGQPERTAMRAPGGPTTPVMTGGWRHAAPVPPAKPWRQREDLPESAISGG